MKYQEIHLELTTFCNFKCSFCPITEVKRKKMHMDVEVAVKIIEEISSSKLAPRVAYHLLGEPLLHPQLNYIIDSAIKNGITNRVVTNGYLLSKDAFAEKLNNCQIVDISLRSSNREEYEINSGRNNYGDYLYGIKTFLDRRKSLNVGLTRVRVFDCDCLKAIIPYHDLSNIMNHKKNKDFKNTLKVDDDLEILIENCIDWKGNSKNYPSRYYGSCDEFEHGFSVLVNGDITTCCWDYDGKNTLGNFLTFRSLEKIITNNYSCSFRKEFARHRVPSPFCSECLGRPNILKSIGYQGKMLLNVFKSKRRIW